MTAVDSAGSSALPLSDTLRIRDRPKLALTPGLKGCGGALTEKTYAQLIRGKNGKSRRHDVNSTLTFPAFIRDDSSNASSTFENCQTRDGTLVIRCDRIVVSNGSTTELGQDTFVNTQTGKLSFTLNVGPGKHTVTLVAHCVSTGDGVSALGAPPLRLSTWTMDVRHKDTDKVTNGPHGRGCGKHGTPEDLLEDLHPQNDAYTCRCDSAFDGDDCDVWEAGMIIGTVLGSVAVLLFAGLLIVQRQLHAAKHRPVDVGAMQTELLRRFGLALPTDIGPNEFGITLTLDNVDCDDQMLDLDACWVHRNPYEDENELLPMHGAPTFDAGAVDGLRSQPAVVDARATAENNNLAQSLQFQQDLAAALTKVVPSLRESMQQVRMSTLRPPPRAGKTSL